MSTRQFKTEKTIGKKTRFVLNPRFIPKITGFKISAHGEFVDNELFEEYFQDYTDNQKTFIVRVRGNFGESVLTRQCSTNFEKTCEGNVCTLGDAANYVNFLQIICGTDDEGIVGIFSALPYKPNGQICDQFANDNARDYDKTSLIPDLLLSRDIKNAFYYGYLTYYNDDNGKTDIKRQIQKFTTSPTYLSSQIIKFYNLVKDSDIDTFTVDVSACLVINDVLKNYCNLISKGNNNIKYQKWFTCFDNFTKNCYSESESDSSESDNSDMELDAGKGKKKCTIKKKVKNKKVKKKKGKKKCTIKKKVKNKKVKNKKGKMKKTKRKKKKTKRKKKENS